MKIYVASIIFKFRLSKMQLFDRHEYCKKKNALRELNLDIKCRLYRADLKHAILERIDICRSIFHIVTDESFIKKRGAHSFLPVKFYLDTMLYE